MNIKEQISVETTLHGIKRIVCRLPIEIMISPYPQAGVRIWLGQGNGRSSTLEELSQYATIAREWADVVDKIVKDEKNDEKVS